MPPLREFEFREEDFGVELDSAGLDEPELRLTLPDEELPEDFPDDPELLTEEPSELVRL